jgi:hypothetical protein
MPDLSPPSPALDFCALIRAKEDTPGGVGAFAILDAGDSAALRNLLNAYYHRAGPVTDLERQARGFLIRYREMERHQGVLNDGERAQLNEILDGTRRPEPIIQRPALPLWKRPILATLATVAAVTGGVALFQATHQHTGPAAAGQVNQHAPAQQVPPQATDLQRTERLLGPWQTIAPSAQRPQTAQPAVLLLQGGTTEASAKWIVPPKGGWVPDQSASIGTVGMHGNWAQITDTDGTFYIVGTN